MGKSFSEFARVYYDVEHTCTSLLFQKCCSGTSGETADVMGELPEETIARSGHNSTDPVTCLCVF